MTRLVYLLPLLAVSALAQSADEWSAFPSGGSSTEPASPKPKPKEPPAKPAEPKAKKGSAGETR